LPSGLGLFADRLEILQPRLRVDLAHTVLSICIGGPFPHADS
jgi:hypothetical protein